MGRSFALMVLEGMQLHHRCIGLTANAWQDSEMHASTLPTSESSQERRFSVLWLAVFAALAVSALLFMFQHVVHAAVAKAQADQIQQSHQAQALWDCNRLAARAERRGCSAALVDGGGATRLPDVLVVSTAR